GLQCAIDHVFARLTFEQPRIRIEQRFVRNVEITHQSHLTSRAAKVEAVPEPTVVNLDPCVSLVAHEPQRYPKRQRRNNERKRAMPAHAFLQQRDLAIQVEPLL